MPLWRLGPLSHSCAMTLWSQAFQRWQKEKFMRRKGREQRKQQQQQQQQQQQAWRERAGLEVKRCEHTNTPFVDVYQR